MLTFHYLSLSLRSQLQYRASFVMQLIAHFLLTAIEFLGLWALFHRFANIRGWTLPEVALFYGSINISLALADSLGRGFHLAADLIKSGDFDRLLLRPRPTSFQILAQGIEPKRLGRLVQATAILFWAATAVETTWTPAKSALLLAAVASGALLFLALFILEATLAFWTTQGLEIMNATTYGGVEAAQYPLSIYHEWFRRFFTVVIPLACVGYWPMLAVLGRPVPASLGWLPWTAPLAGPVFLLVSLAIWKVGVRRYTSTGS
jgi:ABC-2 type transport system permease protein